MGVSVIGEVGDSSRGWSSATGFRSFLAERLGEGWKVEIVARTPDRDKGGEVRSVAAVASRSDNVRLHVTHDRGADVVLLSFEDGPQVPFEDLAVAKGEIETGDLVNLASRPWRTRPAIRRSIWKRPSG